MSGPTHRPSAGEGHPVRADDRRDAIGWVRAIASGLVIAAVSFVGFALAPDLLLASSLSTSREVRVLAATGVTLTWVVVMAWVLRRLQRQGLI